MEGEGLLIGCEGCVCNEMRCFLLISLHNVPHRLNHSVLLSFHIFYQFLSRDLSLSPIPYKKVIQMKAALCIPCCFQASVFRCMSIANGLGPSTVARVAAK